MTILNTIMPISLDPQFEEKAQLIQNIANRYQLQARLPLPKSELPEFNIKEAINEFKQADIVIADLSHERPSCYYELGIAETLGKTICLLAKSGTHIHQTSQRKHVQFYNTLSDYKRILVTFIEECRLTGLAADTKRG